MFAFISGQYFPPQKIYFAGPFLCLLVPDILGRSVEVEGLNL